MTWLVTGGAGYIGAHVVRSLRESGRTVVILDDLSSGHREFVPDDVRFVPGSVTEPGDVDAALDAGPSGEPVTGVVHLAAFKYAGDSVQRPLHTYRQNVTGTHVLLERMLARGVADPGRGPGASAAADLTALLQRGRVRPRGPAGNQRAQPVPTGAQGPER